MKAIIRTAAIALALLLCVGVSYDTGESYCVIFPQNGRDIWGVAQRNILIIGESEVSLVPQVNFEGDARDFGILVPVPARPTLSTVGANVFTDASFMTQPVVRRNSEACGCDENQDVIFGPLLARDQANGSLVDSSPEGVTVISEEIVGTFQAAILQATSASDLGQWLNSNDYRFNPEDSGILQEYVSNDWFFVAMKLDTNQVPPHIGRWWTATTTPAKLTYARAENALIYPLKVSALSTREKTEVLVYTISDDPMTFPGARTEYANALDEAEDESIAQQYPDLSDLIPSGSFVTKLRRTFSKQEMQEDIKIVPSDDRTEFREVQYVNSSGFGVWGLLVLALTIYLNRRKPMKNEG